MAHDLTHWCVPPIRWIQKWFIPAKNDDWQRIAYQPMLYLCIWIGAVLFLTFGDVTAIEPDHTAHSLGWAWLSLSLVCPPLALASLRMIGSTNGYWKYRGLLMRCGSDVGFLTAMTCYLIDKLGSGDFHIYSIWTLVSIVIFVAHLVMRDVKRLIAVEQLAGKIRRGPDLR